MAFPEWSRGAPGPDFEHGDNYSALEVVWTEKATGLVVLETRDGYVHSRIPSASAPKFPSAGWLTDADLLNYPVDARRAELRRKLNTIEPLPEPVPAPSRWSRVEAGVAGFFTGILASSVVVAVVHWSPWH